MTDLLPCPFCGNSDVKKRVEFRSVSGDGLGSPGGITVEHAVCQKCGAQHHYPNDYSIHWNIRIK